MMFAYCSAYCCCVYHDCIYIAAVLTTTALVFLLRLPWLNLYGYHIVISDLHRQACRILRRIHIR